MPPRLRAVPLAAVPPALLSRVQDGDSAGTSTAWGLSRDREMLLLVVVQRGGDGSNQSWMGPLTPQPPDPQPLPSPSG